jgi:hypothetical protein
MKKLILSFICIFAVGLAYCQMPLLTAANSNMQVGETVRIAQTNYLDPGPGGANQTWDFSRSDSLGFFFNTVFNAQSTPYFSTFPNSTHTLIGLLQPGYTVYSYYTYTLNEQQYDGGWNQIKDEYQDTSFMSIKYTKPVKSLVYPFTFGSTYTDSSESINHTNFLTAKLLGTYTLLADAYGSLKTPNGKYNNTLRIRKVEHHYDTLGNLVWIDSAYNWYAPDVHFAVATFSRLWSGSGLLVSSKGYYLSNFTTGIKSLVSNNNFFVLYPNPANFELNLAQVPVGSIISITDINGKEIYYEQVNKNQTKINTSDFVNGVYFVHVSNNEYSSIQKFIVVQ